MNILQIYNTQNMSEIWSIGADWREMQDKVKQVFPMELNISSEVINVEGAA